MSGRWGRRTPAPTRSAQLRRVALERDGWRCTRVEDGRRCTRVAEEVDHIVNLAAGGLDELDNLASLCIPHHKQKTQAEAAAARWVSSAKARRPSEAHPGVASIPRLRQGE